MRFLFDDKAADYETLRAAQYASTGGAELGEVLMAVQGLTGSDPDAWWRGWNGVADRLDAEAAQPLADGRVETAASALLRAANYHRNAEFFLHGDPKDPRIRATSAQAVDDFRAFARLHPGHLADAVVPMPDRDPQLTDLAISEIRIPYEGTTLPGWWLTPVGDDGGERPTLIASGGFDSTAEELYFCVGRAAVEHGWNCLMFDGPGQGRAIREQSLPFRPDWEVPVGAVLDLLPSLPGVDPDRVALLGMSLGGYLSSRAAAFDSRIAALIAWDGIYDANSAFAEMTPPAARDLIDAGRDEEADAILAEAAAHQSTLAWAVGNGTWTFGIESPAAMLRHTRAYTLAGGVAERIFCPTLVLDAEEDHFYKGQPQVLMEHLTAPAELLLMAASDGAGEHCNAGSPLRFTTALFDWLTVTVTRNTALTRSVVLPGAEEERCEEIGSR